MRRRWSFIVLFALILGGALSGCASKDWEKPGAAQEEYEEDSFDCQQRRLNSVYGVLGRSPDTELTAQKFMEECMESRGWTRRK